MQHSPRAVLTLIMLTCLGVPPALPQTGKRNPIPTEEQQSQATQLITGELFKEDIAKAGKKDPIANAHLAGLFLREAKATNDDPAGRYVLLEMARTYAELGVEVTIALEAIDDMASHYRLSPRLVFEKKVAVLVHASKGPRFADATINEKAFQNIIRAVYQLFPVAVVEDEYPLAQQLMQAAENAARKLRDVPQLNGILKDHEKINEEEKKYARWKPFADALSKNPADAQANFALGVYQALLRGNWERGLPLLARSDHVSLKNAAELDLANPGDARKQLALADMWFDLAQKNTVQKLVDDKEFAAGPRVVMLLHAYQWYQDALSSLTGKDRDHAEKRQQKIIALLPPEFAIGDLSVPYRVWDLNTPAGRKSNFVEPVYCAAFSPDSKKVIAASTDGVLHLFDLLTGKELSKLAPERTFGESPRIWTVCFSSDGRHVLTGGFDGTIRLWDLVSGREVRKFTGTNDYIRSVVASRDGKLVLSGGDDRKLRLWNEETGQEIRTFQFRLKPAVDSEKKGREPDIGHDHFVWCVDLSRNSTQAVSAGLDRTVRLWDVATGKQLQVLRGHKDTVLSVAFTPDGRHALSGSSDKTLILWDLENGKHIVFPELPGYVNSVAVSPDGRRALSGSQDPRTSLTWNASSEKLPSVLCLWDLQTGKELRFLRGHLDQVWHVAFSPDGRLGLSCGQDGTVRVWSGSKYR